MKIRMLPMKLTAVVLSAFAFATIANAQVTIEMRNIKCQQYLALTPAQSAAFSAWMSGWYSYKIGKTWVDLVAYRKNIANVQAWCRYHPQETVMSGLDKSAAGQ
jgi:acid stress chaperone HdeB